MKKMFDSQNNIFSAEDVDVEVFERFSVLRKYGDYYSMFESGYNGGFYYGKALQLYGFSKREPFNNLENINQLLLSEFNDIILKGEIAFAQEIFGNQFMFDTLNDKIIFFNIETGEKEIVADSFLDWVDIVLSDIDYYTGRNVEKSWVNINTEELLFSQRLCSKLPFILGGDYVVDNLHPVSYPDYIRINSNIAKQVYNLPNGTEFTLKIKNENDD
jgi:hypothetical protein